MAGMYPEDIEGDARATEGEKRVFRFLKEATGPRRAFTCWYKPPIGPRDRTPDFVLFAEKTGLLVIQVKDWTASQLVSYNPRRFTVRVSGKIEERTNPDRQARDCVNALKERLAAVPEFLSDHLK